MHIPWSIEGSGGWLINGFEPYDGLKGERITDLNDISGKKIKHTLGANTPGCLFIEFTDGSWIYLKPYVCNIDTDIDLEGKIK
jgi:hypothetical protein